MPPANEEFGFDPFADDPPIDLGTHPSSPELVIAPTRPVASRRSRIPIMLLGALVAGCIGAFVIARVMEHPYAVPSEPAARIAKSPDSPERPALVAENALPAPGATAAAVAASPVSGAPAAAMPAPAASPSDAPIEPPVEHAAAGPGTAERASASAAKPRVHPIRAAKPAGARIKIDADAPAEPSAPAPRSDDKAAPEPGPPEPAKPEMSPPEIASPRPHAAETSEPARPVPRQDPPAPTPQPGAIDVATTRAAMRAQLVPVQQCYERARMDDPSLTGTVVVRITIGADGAVTNVEIVNSSLGAPQVEACIRQGISRWRLPRPTRGASASLLYPLVFE